MQHVYFSHLGNKAQVTLPKAVRKALSLREARDLVGFIVDGRRVALTRIEPVPTSDPFTDEEWEKIRGLAAKPPAAAGLDSQASLRHLKSRLKPR
ncbi:MAG: AbrB/MazE/SpoVT family DNA-binding domain-containing protein [Elusimicrobia bacterium]|nr:AbrB/MazE/SpoVT family DNA-binding domain-containing protein [Elusimicrobiota bacterium]